MLFFNFCSIKSQLISELPLGWQETQSSRELAPRGWAEGLGRHTKPQHKAGPRIHDVPTVLWVLTEPPRGWSLMIPKKPKAFCLHR